MLAADEASGLYADAHFTHREANAVKRS